MVWTHGEDSLIKFIEYLNSLHSTIKFTHEFSYTQIDFLDTTVKFGANRTLITTLYNKPTDTHLYLEYSSAHPESIHTKGPYGQYLRLRRICSLDTDFELNAKKLTGYYLKRGYPFPSLKNTTSGQGNLPRINFWTQYLPRIMRFLSWSPNLTQRIPK